MRIANTKAQISCTVTLQHLLHSSYCTADRRLCFRICRYFFDFYLFYFILFFLMQCLKLLFVSGKYSANCSGDFYACSSNQHLV